MTVLLDTSVVIALERLDLRAVGNQQPVVGAVTLAELAYGLDIGDETVRRARDHRFRRALETFEVIPFGVGEAKLYGVLATLVRAAGRNPRPRRLDLQIAATAAAGRLPLVTANADDFAGVERLVEIVAVS